MTTTARQRSGQHPEGWHSNRYTAAHKAERARRLAIKAQLRCPRCPKPIAHVPDSLLNLDHCDDCEGKGCRACSHSGYLDGLAHRACNMAASARNTNRKRKQRPYTRARARAALLSTRAAGSTQQW